MLLKYIPATKDLREVISVKIGMLMEDNRNLKRTDGIASGEKALGGQHGGENSKTFHVKAAQPRVHLKGLNANTCSMGINQ